MLPDRIVPTDYGDFEFAVTSKLRHGVLWRLVQEHGGQAALARKLGINANVMCRLVNMRGRPPVNAKWWPAFLDQLLFLTGKTADELFPQWISSEGFVGLPREDTQYKRVAMSEVPMIDEHNPSERLESDETNYQLNLMMKSELSWREMEILRMRYGLDGREQMTLQEVAKVMKCGKERVRQIEAKAVRRMQMSKRLRKLERTAFDEMGPLP